MATAERVKELRASTGLSQTAFGKTYGGIPRRTIQNWEAGINVPPPYVINLLELAIKSK